MTTWEKKYKVIYADPPWNYGVWGKPSNKRFAKSADKEFKLPYQSMSVEEIKSLSVSKLADENCELYLWTTQKYLPYSFDVITSWGARYCQTITWCKKSRGLGQGGIYCPTTEFLLLARYGKMPKKRREDTTWFLVTRPNNAHSKKPYFFRKLIEKVSDAPRIELFAREKHKGWDVWGDEVDSDVVL